MRRPTGVHYFFGRAEGRGERGGEGEDNRGRVPLVDEPSVYNNCSSFISVVSVDGNIISLAIW